MSARDKLRGFFEANVGRIIDTHQLREVAGVSEYARRIRELRDQEGMQILTHKDRHDLKPGQYILTSMDRAPKLSSAISPQLRANILERNGYTCQQCGAGPGDRDPYNPKRKTRLHIDHILPLSQGGSDSPENLRVLCSSCNQVRSNIQAPSESALNMLARIRKAPKSVQKEVYAALKKTFEQS